MKKETKNKKILEKQYPNNSNHKYLRCTNILLIIPFLIFIFNKEKPLAEYLLSALLIITIIFSQLFWNNPIKYSITHKVDAIIAKISICSFFLYTVIYKFKFSYLLVLLGVFISFYFSNYYSTQQWCSTQHLCCHGILHILCFIGTLYVF